ncbi:ADP-ribosylation [Hypomontagnella monticulosa]|nr:ADP-ribosylation [Hypomontagnella monticulosa]
MATMTGVPELSEDELVELSLLRDFEVDELVKAGLLSEDELLTAPLDEEIIFKHDELNLHVTAGPLYPVVPVTWNIDNRLLARGAVDSLREELRQIVDAAKSTNNIVRWKNREEECEFGIFRPTMVVLELAKKTVAHLESAHQKEAAEKPGHSAAETYVPFETKMVNPMMTSSEVAYHYLQETPQEICSRIPPHYRILHVEEVLRVDLARKFHDRQEDMRQKLSKQPHSSLHKYAPPNIQYTKRKNVLVEHIVKPRVTFHGTMRHVVSSIVRYGFLKPGDRVPGTKEKHEIRSGSLYGRGIYSSPNPDFSLSYTGDLCHATKPNEYFGIKLLVCATLMGRWADMDRDVDWREQSSPYPGADSHIANRGLEYVVFDTAQILPVYVVHIDWGQDNLKHFVDLPRDPWNFVPAKKKMDPRLLGNIRWPGEIKQAKEAAMTRASKWFPYGYGPATGGRFVVEEIGEVDEDEEEYGDYQQFRGEEIKGNAGLNFWSWVKVGEEMDAAERGEDTSLDEYTHHRKWHGAEASGTKLAWDDIPDPRDNGEDEDENGDLGLALLVDGLNIEEADPIDV